MSLYIKFFFIKRFNNYKKKYFLKINKTDRNIYDSNTYNDKYFKENDSINLTSINQNGKKKNKLNQYFNKKFINSSFNKQIRNNQYITDQFDLFNLSKEKKEGSRSTKRNCFKLGKN